MKLLWIVLAVIAVLLLLILALPLYGKASIRIICKKRLKLVLTVAGVPITLVSDKEKTPPVLRPCRNPDRVLKKELRLQKKRRIKAEKKKRKAAIKAQKKKQKKALAAKRPSPNLQENIEMVLALLRELYDKTAGRIDFRIRRMHLYLASKDAATTALLYAGALQTLAYLFEWIQTHFNRVERDTGAMEVIADFGSEKPHVDIDLSITLHLSAAIAIALGMLKAYRRERRLALRKAKYRALKKQYRNQDTAA